MAHGAAVRFKWEGFASAAMSLGEASGLSRLQRPGRSLCQTFEHERSRRDISHGAAHGVCPDGVGSGLDGGRGWLWFRGRLPDENAPSLGATVDQAGLAVFFLQRHRVELVLKDLLGFLGVKFPATHSLGRLWRLCQEGFECSDLDWEEFEAENGEFIDALIAVDDGAATFRFPVNHEGAQIDRPAFIDLKALNRHADKLYWEAAGCMDYVAEARAQLQAIEADVLEDATPHWGDY